MSGFDRFEAVSMLTFVNAPGGLYGRKNDQSS